jgi:hypothetical protein
MNVFEDLIEELKEENLLEETVIETNQKVVEENSSEALVLTAEDIVEETEIKETPTDNEIIADQTVSFQVEDAVPPQITSFESHNDFEIQMPLSELQKTQVDNILPPEIVVSKPKKSPTLTKNFPSKRVEMSGKEYFRKRAVDEVTGLQMVEHVLSGVERGQMKIVPKPFDDIPVKKALHDFMQIASDANSSEHARSEFQLMQETESWYSALSHRDKHISVAHLRRYCETTKPALSPQALIALGRFYRNSPFSEQVRSKFDLVMTRLFSNDNEDDKRQLLFEHDELIEQVKALYAEWSSIQVYSADEDDSEILIANLKFEDFIKEAESAKNFDELINNDFFNRLRMFKETCQENFFAPLVTVAAIESNIRIGNRYVELIQKERENANAATLEERYGFLHDQAISDATSKSFQLIELLKERTEINRIPVEIVEVEAKENQTARSPRTAKKQKSRLFAINKWLLGFAIITLIGCFGLYFWAEQKTKEAETSNKNVVKVNLDNSSLKEYLETARINEKTFYGVTKTSWETANREKKEELLNQMLKIGAEKGFEKVHLVNEKGVTVGFGSAEKVEIFNP